MIDLHCHLLPGIDDGPATLPESLTLAAELAADGYSAWPQRLTCAPTTRESSTTSWALGEPNCKGAIDAAGIALQVLPGAEVDLAYGLELSDDELRVLSLGGNGRDSWWRLHMARSPTCSRSSPSR